MAASLGWVVDLGRMAYPEACGLQEQLVVLRRHGTIADTLLLVEHPPVITLGRRAHQAHILASPAGLRAAGVEVFESSRGGDVTYHGPGQLVGYPIVDLRPRGSDVHAYLRELEEVLIGVLSTYGLKAERKAGCTGAWVRDEKVAAIGIAVRGWVTSHGFALNVAPIMEHFSLIVPCGLAQYRVTSLAHLLGAAAPTMEQVKADTVYHFGRVFDLHLKPTSLAALPLAG